MKCGGLGALALAAGLLFACGASSTADDGEAAGSDQDADAIADSDSDSAGGGASGSAGGGDGEESSPASDDSGDTSTTATTSPPTSFEVTGSVTSADDDAPVAGAVISAGDETTTTDAGGGFSLTVDVGQDLLIRRPTFLPVVIDAPTEDGAFAVALEPVLARGVRVSRYVAADREDFRALLDQLEGTAVNSLVFDTKDETGEVLYETGVEKAAALGAVNPVYRPDELLALTAERGLYPITRVVTFEDKIWARTDAEAKLAGAWVDATDRANWEYPLALASEACQLGFAEIQFDYVRYPAGRTAEVAAARVPRTADERAAVIAAFLAEARSQLEPQGCGVSAAIFGIVMSSETDEGIGQTVEAVGAEVDALSPMLYPSHYGPGWLGFADPNDHPGPVIADALDDGIPRLTGPTQMRPWIQAFYYNGAQIGAQISEAEARGAGWLLWNASGNYRDDWLPEAG